MMYRVCRVTRGRAGTLVQWLNLPAWKVRDLGFEPHSGLQVSKKQNEKKRLRVHRMQVHSNCCHVVWMKV